MDAVSQHLQKHDSPLGPGRLADMCSQILEPGNNKLRLSFLLDAHEFR